MTHNVLLLRAPILFSKTKGIHSLNNASKRIGYIKYVVTNTRLSPLRTATNCRMWSSTTLLNSKKGEEHDNGSGTVSGNVHGNDNNGSQLDHQKITPTQQYKEHKVIHHDDNNNNNINDDKKTPIDNVVSSTTSSMMKYLPPSTKPYAELARLDKPIGTMLLLWPCCWSTAIAATASASESASANTSIIGDPKLLALFATGSFLMRGAGCTINDMWDAKYDKQVKRTATRPIASGVLTYKQATEFLALQLTGGLAVLTSLPHLEYCFVLGASSLPFVIAYPLMKRYTNWPQLVLGMTFNWGALMGWAATHGTLDAYDGLSVVLPLYAGGVSWTLVYDTLYAHQDKDDDATLGLKSTALHFGNNTKPILYGFSTLATGSWMLAGYNVGFEAPYYFIGCGAAGAHLAWQVATADLQNAKNLAERFKSNNTVGALLFASCVAGNISALDSLASL